MFGTILEIRTGNDRETENDTPDIYCSFDPPALSMRRSELERVFSALYNEPKHLDELGLDFVIMAPDMIMPLADPEQDYPSAALYVVVSHWASDGESGSYEAPFTDLADARLQFHEDLLNELERGSIASWKANSQFVEEETSESYECYLDGEYCENHFSIALEHRQLPLSPAFLRTVAELYQAEPLRNSPKQPMINDRNT